MGDYRAGVGGTRTPGGKECQQMLSPGTSPFLFSVQPFPLCCSFTPTFPSIARLQVCA